MLREGWDVPEVGVVLLLRKFGSRVYGQQVIGRGLRRVRGRGIGESEPQICAAVDHPKLEHGWLWDIFGSRIRSGVGTDDEFDEDEDLPDPPPRQEADAPENFIDIPDPSEDDVDEFVIDIDEEDEGEPLENWREVLDALEYPAQTVTVTGQDISGVERRELTGEGWRALESAPDGLSGIGASIETDPDALADAVKEALLTMADDLLENAGFSMQFKGRIYVILLEHVRTKFLDGASLGLAEPHHLESAWRTLDEVGEKIASTPGLVEGMVKYGD